MNDMNDMTTVLDQHVQAVLNQPVDDLFTYNVSDAALEIVRARRRKRHFLNCTSGAETRSADCPLLSLSGLC